LTLDKYWNVSDKYHGVIVASAVDVRSSPLDRGENVIFRVHEGTKVEIQNFQSGWSEIVLLDGKKGWVLSKDIREI
jgi:SH3-like domain-containing protein